MKSLLYGVLRKTSNQGKITWDSLKRAGGHNLATHSPGCFYPIYVAADGSKIVEVGDVYPLDKSISDVEVIEGTVAIFPMQENDQKGCWQTTPDKLRLLIEKGYVKLGRFTGPNSMAISYLKRGEQQKVESGFYKVIDYRPDGSIIVDEDISEAPFIPGTQWNISSHNAKQQGTILLSKILGKNIFTFPKSLYAVRDAIRFVVSNKPGALIVDFFAGSGTTLHAVNLLNAEDGGQRRCIMVTNNEVSEAESKSLADKGFKPGDKEWDELGIARYVTWKRTVCSIKGIDIKGSALKGNYIDSNIPMSDGFRANVSFFKLGFLDKNAVAIGRQFKELVPVLWMKAGAIGECPVYEEENPGMLVLPKNKFAVLADERMFMEFIEELDKYPEIETVYIVTDSDRAYRDMIAFMDGKNTYQLYRDYLDNFRINSVRR